MSKKANDTQDTEPGGDTGSGGRRSHGLSSGSVCFRVAQEDTGRILSVRQGIPPPLDTEEIMMTRSFRV